MGIAKYNEDNSEEISNRLERPFVASEFYSSNAIIKAKANPIKYKCSYCPMIFEYDNSLFMHVRMVHYGNRPIIVINDVIPGEVEEYYIDRITNVLVYFNHTNCTMTIDGNEIQVTNAKQDITEIIIKELSVKQSVMIQINDIKLRIIKKSIESIKNPDIDIIISDWDALTESNKNIKLGSMDSYNFAERQYLEAFFDYYTACLANHNDKKNRYYDTFKILKSFISIDNRALLVMKVIAFKLNWIDYLNKLSSENDDFKMITYFYKMKSYETGFNNDGNRKLYIEDDLELYITIVRAYFCENFDSVDQYLESINIMEISDDNYKDKLIFLKVRRLIDKKHYSEAIELYPNIGTPRLRESCEEELNNRKNKGV